MRDTESCAAMLSCNMLLWALLVSVEGLRPGGSGLKSELFARKHGILAANGYAEARAAAAAKRAGQATSPPPTQAAVHAPSTQPVIGASQRVLPGDPAPSESIRQLLEIMGSRIVRLWCCCTAFSLTIPQGSDGQPLRQHELDTFLRVPLAAQPCPQSSCLSRRNSPLSSARWKRSQEGGATSKNPSANTLQIS